ncbi:hypothetical protein ABZ766_11805 [Streptomyces sp. NPDC006670]|uniref:hypothetical protein n=1 Tax=Streptomyces sp. NPDC006670 TaxID=3154476 RepID=UPI0033C0358F
MAAPPHPKVHTPPGPPTPSPRWPDRAPRLAAAWAAGYAAVEITWATTGTTVPWKAHASYAPAVQLLLAALALLAGAASLAPTRTLAATALTAALPVFAIGAIGLPIHFVTLVTLSGVESATGLAQVLLNTAGAALLFLVLLAHRRRLRGDCPRCGRPHPVPTDEPLVHPAPTRPSARTRTAAYLLMCGLLPWAGVKTIWLLGGDALGVAAANWQRTTDAGASGPAKAAASVGVDITVAAAAVGVLLLLGLLHPWGQVFPRWTAFLSGRRVPRLLPLLPAWLTGIPLTLYGTLLVLLAPLMATGALPVVKPSPPFTTSSGVTWMVEFGGLALAGLGLALLVAAHSYATRTRPRCPTAAP